MTADDVLDAATVEGLRQLDDGGGLAEVVATYRRDADQRLDDLGRLAAAGDAAGVARVAHSLKGSSAMMGAAQVAGTCAQIEAVAGDGDLAGAVEPLERLRDEWTRAMTALEDVFGTPG